MGLTFDIAGERVDDPKCDVIRAEREPHGRPRFGIRESDGAGKKFGHLILSFNFGN